MKYSTLVELESGKTMQSLHYFENVDGGVLRDLTREWSGKKMSMSQRSSSGSKSHRPLRRPVRSRTREVGRVSWEGDSP